jgi:hypothetical protein
MARAKVRLVAHAVAALLRSRLEPDHTSRADAISVVGDGVAGQVIPISKTYRATVQQRFRLLKTSRSSVICG